MHEEFKKINEKVLEIRTPEQLVEILNTYGIKTENWGLPNTQTKTVGHLFKEIQDGESIIVESNKELLRKVKALALCIQYKDKDNNQYILEEQHQIFLDNNRVKVRKHWAAVGEKLRTNEKPNKDSVTRALREELDINGEADVEYVGESVENHGTSYPGLKSENTMYKYIVNLEENQYNQVGYVEIQGDKQTCFKWKKIEDTD